MGMRKGMRMKTCHSNRVDVAKDHKDADACSRWPHSVTSKILKQNRVRFFSPTRSMTLTNLADPYSDTLSDPSAVLANDAAQLINKDFTDPIRQLVRFPFKCQQ